MIGADLASIEKSSGRAYLYTLTATRAARFAPVVVKISDDESINAAAHQIPNVCALNLSADANTARAEDAAIVVSDEALV